MAVSGGSAGCNNPDVHRSLVDYLADEGHMSYGQRADDLDNLTDRNRDRVRMLKHVAQHPEGVKQTILVHQVLKGLNPTTYHGTPDLSGDASERYDNWADKYYNGHEYVRLDGSDPDYQFANRFFSDLAEDSALVRIEDRKDGDGNSRWLFPTLDLLDLISYGITETATQPDDLVYDRQFCLNLLKTTRSRLLKLPDFAKELFANSLRRYIQRIRDYRLAFDVRLVDRTGMDKRRMYKPYKTRFTDDGRRDRMFARLQDSLDWGAKHAETAVFCTLTTDPKNFDTLYEAIMAINKNFHALNQYMARDPSTKADTRKPGVSSWTGPDCGTTGRPRESLEYVKVLEFTERGYPHLHVLYFDPPRRESDGMPWLIDKAELSHYWDKDTESRPGQGRIVDTYPLVYRDDLDDLDAEFNDDSGFVSWYRYGDHDHSQEWVESQAKHHQEDGQIDFDGDDDNPMQKTAGSYIGKYLSKMYEQLLQLESLDGDDFQYDDGSDAPLWKLALYWATERRFWSPSRQIERDIALDADTTDIRRGVAACTTVSLHHYTDRCHESHAAYPNLDHDKARSLLYRLSRDLVAQMDLDARDAGQTQTTLAHIDYLGTYRYDRLPARPETTVSPEVFEKNVANEDCDLQLASLGDRPPPPATVWH